MPKPSEVIRFIGRSSKRVAVSVAGFTLLAAGLAGLVFPILPGWLLIIVGLAVLATEYAWARSLLNTAKDRAKRVRTRLRRRKPPEPEVPPPADQPGPYAR
jgi:hypothetical protein